MCGGPTYRIYAITWKNKLLGSVLALVITTELFTGLLSTCLDWVEPR
jgi:hypothetical protein